MNDLAAASPHSKDSQRPSAVHAHTEPVFTSHISQVFTSQMAREEQMRETSRQREATWLESKQKAHQTVFGWRYVPKVFIHESLLMVFQENVVPALFEVQEGFVWPHYPKFGRSLVSWLHQYFRRYSFQPWPLDYGKNQPRSQTQRFPTHICQSDSRSTLPGFYQVPPLHIVVNHIPQYPNQPCRGAYLREEKNG